MAVSTSHLFQIFARTCTCLMETEPRIAIFTLLNVKGSLENHLLQVRKEKKKKKNRVVVVECMFVLVACTHSHAHTLAPKRSHQAGMSAVFIYHGGAHLIEGLIFMGFVNMTLPLLPHDRIWPSTHGESTIWHMQPLIIFSFQWFFFFFTAANSSPFMVALLSYTQCKSSSPPPRPHHSEMSLMIELSFTHFKWLL